MLKKNKIKKTMEVLYEKNITNKILMVRPALFAFNEETAVNNYYQKEIIRQYKKFKIVL